MTVRPTFIYHSIATSFICVMLIASFARNVDASTLTLNRLALFFENGRAETTILRNEKVRVHGELLYSGSGLLEGYWEVDGRVLGHVSRHLSGSGSVSVPGPKTSLPTMDPGTHLLHFVVTSPVTAYPPPALVYFVLPKDAPLPIVKLKRLKPAEGSELPYAPINFSWESEKDSELYLISFTSVADGRPVFSAYTRKTSYQLPEKALKAFFSHGTGYSWRVVGFKSDHQTISEKASRKFSFKAE